MDTNLGMDRTLQSAAWRSKPKHGRPSVGRASALRRMPLLVRLCVGILILAIIVAIIAPVIAPHDPARQTLVSRLQPPALFEGGSTDNPLGTDHLGRDILSRALYGARVSLTIGLLGMVIGMVLGSAIGMISGFARGIADDILMLLVDAQLAVPFILVALAGIAIFGTSLAVLIVLVGLAGWESYARISRAMVLRVRESPYVLAARALGASRTRILLRHILPNVSAPIIVLATFQLTAIIVLESSLSFLGIGVQPPTPSWGAMIGEGRNYLNTSWWIAVIPGGAIVLVTTSISLLGDWLRDALDPTLRGR